METVPLNTLFDVVGGSRLDANKMTFVEQGVVNFISRESNNNGCVGAVEQLAGEQPFPAGLITVSLGGSFLLSSFVQPTPFYTAQNVAVLIPKRPMSLNEKLFYCKCISMNRFKYSAFGREANKTLKGLLVPKHVPPWAKTPVSTAFDDLARPVATATLSLSERKWKWFRYDLLFDIERGRGARKKDLEGGDTPFITSIASNNGLTGYTATAPAHPGNVLAVNRNGCVGEAHYQAKPFCSTEDVHVFRPKFALNAYIAMFLIALIRKEKYRYSFGRKWGLERMNESRLRLPVDARGNPDWKFMESYIQSLKYSARL